MSKVAIIGAGKTGRGFLARLLREEQGPEIVFVDKNEELVRRLNEAGAFKVHFFGGVREPKTVSGFKAYTWQDEGLSEELAQCGTVLVAVGGQNLPDVAASLKAIPGCLPQAYLTAENASHPAKTLLEGLGRPAQISEGTVFCTTIEAEGLDISSENYPYFQYNADPLPGYTAPVTGLKPVNHFSDFLTRKLYTYNAAACVIAYLGWVKGYRNFADAGNDPEIVEKLDCNYAATNRVLCAEFGYDKQDQEEFALLSRTKFMSRVIEDTVARNARDPQRKMAAGERIMGPIRLMEKYGEDSSVLIETAAATLLYDEASETAWMNMLAEKGREGVLCELCGLKPEEKITKEILAAAERMA